MVGSVELKIKLEAVFTQEEDVWIASCPALDLFTQAESKEAAAEALREATVAWFESCLERNVLPQALADVGFRVATPGKIVSSNGDTVQVASPPSPSTRRQVEEVEVSIPAYVAVACSSSTHAAY